MAAPPEELPKKEEKEEKAEHSEEEAAVVALEPTLIQGGDQNRTRSPSQEEVRAAAVPAPTPLGPEDHAHIVFKRLDLDDLNGNGKISTEKSS